MNEIEKILNNSKLTAQIIGDSLIHPVLQTTDYKPREVFGELKEISDIFFSTRETVRMVGLAGLRGTGKTTLVWQIADYIFKNYTQNIYFFNIADLQNYNIGVKEIHRAFEEYIVKSKLWSYKEPIVLLFDEVHEDSEWARALKVLSDDFRTALIFATGSSALLLQSTADLVTRMLIQHVFPLSFPEFLNIKNSETAQFFEQKEYLKNTLFYSENINQLHDNLQAIKPDVEKYYINTTELYDKIIDYISYRNITRFSFLKINSQIDRLIVDLIRRVVYEDIPKMTAKTEVHYSEKILRRLAASDEINIQTLSQAIGISQNQIYENLDILEKAELLNTLYPYGGIDTKINKAQKYFFMSPSIRRVLLSPLTGNTKSDEVTARLLEDIVVMYLKRVFRQDSILSFASQKKGKNPDLIIETLPEPVIIEIGINKKTIRQISKSNIKYKYGIIINATTNEVVFNEKDNVIIIPLSYFLLL